MRGGSAGCALLALMRWSTRSLCRRPVSDGGAGAQRLRPLPSRRVYLRVVAALVRLTVFEAAVFFLPTDDAPDDGADDFFAPAFTPGLRAAVFFLRIEVAAAGGGTGMPSSLPLVDRAPPFNFFEAPSSWRCNEPIIRPRDSADRISSELSMPGVRRAGSAFPCLAIQVPPRGPSCPRALERASSGPACVRPRFHISLHRCRGAPKIWVWPSRIPFCCCLRRLLS